MTEGQPNSDPPTPVTWDAVSEPLTWEPQPDLGVFRLTTDSPSFQNPCCMTFYGDANRKVGELTWQDGTMRFIGSADESAKIFFRELGACMNTPTEIL